MRYFRKTAWERISPHHEEQNIKHLRRTLKTPRILFQNESSRASWPGRESVHMPQWTWGREFILYYKLCMMDGCWTVTAHKICIAMWDAKIVIVQNTFEERITDMKWLEDYKVVILSQVQYTVCRGIFLMDGSYIHLNWCLNVTWTIHTQSVTLVWH